MRTTAFLRHGLMVSALLMPTIVLADEATTVTREMAETAIQQAEETTGEAGKLGHEWRDTGKMIKHARKALEAGDFVRAVKTAREAQAQSAAAIEQAKSQPNPGPRF